MKHWGLKGKDPCIQGCWGLVERYIQGLTMSTGQLLGSLYVWV